MQLKQAITFLKSVPMLSNIMPILKSFHIYNGRIQITNLDVIVDIPCKTFKGQNFTVPSEIFIKAITACELEPVCSILDNDRLEVKQGSFKAKIPLFNHNDYPLATHEKFDIPIPKKNFIEVLRRASLFAGNSKASTRHWSNGVCFREGHLYATNTITVMRQPADFSLTKEVTVNLDMLKTLVAIGEEPEAIGIEPNFISFKFHNGAWVKCRLLEDGWPDATRFFVNQATEVIPKGLASATLNMIPFSEKDTFISNGKRIMTEEGDYCANNEGFKIPPCSYKLSELSEILKISDKFDFSKYPQSTWSGPGVEGITVGMRMDQ
jgi:hypothetical protein